MNIETIPAQQKENGMTAPLPVGRGNPAPHGSRRANGMWRKATGRLGRGGKAAKAKDIAADHWDLFPIKKSPSRRGFFVYNLV